MFNHLRPAWAEINLDNLAYNMKQIKKLCNSKEIIAVVKADAYGHGALDTAPVLLENGATMLGVAVLSEAIELRNSGVKCPILILGFTPYEFSDDLIDYEIDQTVYNYEYAEYLSKAAVKKNKKARVHIALDTGMRRIGYQPDEEALEEIYRISKLPNIELSGIFSHFSTSDEEDKAYTNLQFNKFTDFCNKLQQKGINIKLRHIANSAAVMELKDTHLDAVRPGIIMYGYYPSNEVDRSVIDLKPAMSVKANVVHIKKLPCGEYISYGRKFVTNRETMIATIPIGYADGYNRLLSNKAKVIINGKFAPVVGRVCMDQCMIDVTGIEDVKLGDVVTLLGSEGKLSFTADDMAEIMGTINYEVTCMISKRIPRVYMKDDKIVKVRNYV